LRDVLSEQVTDAHLAGLPEDGVSYMFAGACERDLEAAARETRSALSLSIWHSSTYSA
jgi:hypothetical protein